MDTQGEIEECLQEQIDKGENYIISNQEPLKESNL